MVGRFVVFRWAMVICPWLLMVSGEGSQISTFAVAPAWRKPDVNGRSCASCHSPDGLEIAAYSFSDEDILRRAQAHLSVADSREIVKMIHELRDRYGIVKLLDPMNDRPMQPGGSVLAGANPMERDAAFAMRLPSMVPALFNGPIDSLRAAKAARDQLLAVDLNRLQIGIPFNRLSEDGYRGREHATIADWIPDVPILNDYPDRLRDAYLADPSQATFEALDTWLANDNAQATPAQQISLYKRRAILYFQHRLRTTYTGKSGGVRLAKPNPMWAFGDFARENSNVSLVAMGFPKDILAKKLEGPESKEQLKQIRLSWMWLGWCMDPGLQKTSPLPETMRADYFSNALWSDGPYPMHVAFMMSRKIASESFVTECWNSTPPQHLDLDYSGLTGDGGIRGPEPPRGKPRRLFETFVRNSFRMNLYLQFDELSRRRIVYLRQALIQQIRRMKSVLRDPKDIVLADRVLHEIGKCRDANRWRHGQA